MRDNTNEMELYAEYLMEDELSENTRAVYLREAKAFLEYLGGRKITKKETIEYKKYLLSRSLKASSTNLYIIAVNRYLKYSGFECCMIKTEKLQKRHCPENIIDKAEYKKMLDYAQESGNKKYYCIMRTLALTGIRISELSDCTVEALTQGKFITSNKGKIREVYLPDKLICNLLEYCETESIETGPIFIGNTGRAISRTAVYKMFIHIADMTGVSKEKVHPHSFRHLFAITYMEQYSNLFELADILGHSSLEVTRIYTSATAKAKRGRMNLLNL